jgi:hypothetical protein
MQINESFGAKLIRPVIQQQQDEAKQGVRRVQAQVRQAQRRGALAIRAVLASNVGGTGNVLDLKA